MRKKRNPIAKILRDPTGLFRKKVIKNGKPTKKKLRQDKKLIAKGVLPL